MKHWAMGMRILVVVAAAGLMLGCEKNQPPEEAAPYNPSIDAPPTNLQLNPDMALLADQARLSGVKPAASKAPAAGGAEDPSAKAVRAEMAKIIDAAKTGQWQAIATYAAPKDADTVKDAATALAARAMAEDVLKKAVKASWRKEPPSSMAQLLEPGPDGGPFLARLPEMSAETLAVTPIDADTVEVKDRTGAKLTFKKSDDKWQLALSDTQVQVYAALAELAKLQAQAAKELTDGISTSTIGEQNADAAIMDKAKTVGDAMKRIKEAMEADQPKAGTPEGGSGDAAGGSSGATTAPAGDAAGGSSGATTAPAGDTPAPAGDTPAPAGATTAPAGDTPAPAGDTPAPAGDTPAPAGGASGGNE